MSRVVDVKDPITLLALLHEGQSDLIVMEFFSEGCGPCVVAKRTLESLADVFDGQPVGFATANVALFPNVTEALGITAVPAVFLFRHGEVVDQQIRAIRETSLRIKIESQLNVGTSFTRSEA